MLFSLAFEVDFGRTAANLEYEERRVVARKILRHAQIDESSLFLSRYNLDIDAGFLLQFCT